MFSEVVAWTSMVQDGCGHSPQLKDPGSFRFVALQRCWVLAPTACSCWQSGQEGASSGPHGCIWHGERLKMFFTFSRVLARNKGNGYGVTNSMLCRRRVYLSFNGADRYNLAGGKKRENSSLQEQCYRTPWWNSTHEFGSGWMRMREQSTGTFGSVLLTARNTAQFLSYFSA